MDNPKNKLKEVQPAPTGFWAWVAFIIALFALASICLSFVSPYWIQSWPLSESEFKNMGLWWVCFDNYMQFKDDSQQIYSACWWVFSSEPRYYKLREWLIPPWFISCQVLVVGILIVEIIACAIVALIFLHVCPQMNHEYIQTYGMFAAGSMMFLSTMISFVVAMVFGAQTNDRYWLPRPDFNYLSWGYGFLIISGLLTLAAGIIMFRDAQNAYDVLIIKEDEYTRTALEMSTYHLDQYPPPYDIGPEYRPYDEASAYPIASVSGAANDSAAAAPIKPQSQIDSAAASKYLGKSFQSHSDGDDFA